MKINNPFLYFINKHKYLIGNEDFSELLKGSITTFGLKVSGYILSYVFYFFIAKIYGAKALGIFAIAVTISLIFGIIGKLGTETSMIRFIAENADSPKSMYRVHRKAIKMVLLVSALCGFIIFMTSPLLSLLISHESTAQLSIKIIAFTIPFMAITAVNTASLRGLKKIRESFIFESVVPPMLNTITLLLLTYLFIKSYLTPIYAYLIGFIIIAILSSYVWSKNISGFIFFKETKKVLKIDDISIRSILKISVPMMVTSTMWIIMSWTDIIMLGMFLGTHEVGVYTIVVKISLVVSFVIIAMDYIAAPKFAELYASGDINRLKYVAKLSSRLMFWAALPILVVIIIFATQILNTFGNEFISGVTALIILGIGQFARIALGCVGYFLNMTGEQDTFRNIMVLATIINIALNIALIPRYGINGAAMATLISTLCWNLLASFRIHKKFGYWIGYIPKFIKL